MVFDLSATVPITLASQVERHAMPCAFLPITLVLKEMQILRNIVA
jgi:hypothetical protein